MKSIMQNTANLDLLASSLESVKDVAKAASALKANTPSMLEDLAGLGVAKMESGDTGLAASLGHVISQLDTVDFGEVVKAANVIVAAIAKLNEAKKPLNDAVEGRLLSNVATALVSNLGVSADDVEIVFDFLDINGSGTIIAKVEGREYGAHIYGGEVTVISEIVEDTTDAGSDGEDGSDGEED